MQSKGLINFGKEGRQDLLSSFDIAQIIVGSRLGLKMHHSIWKILLVLGADEYIERLEGKIRNCLFFYVKIF